MLETAHELRPNPYPKAGGSDIVPAAEMEHGMQLAMMLRWGIWQASGWSLRCPWVRLRGTRPPSWQTVSRNMQALKSPPNRRHPNSNFPTDYPRHHREVGKVGSIENVDKVEKGSNLKLSAGENFIYTARRIPTVLRSSRRGSPGSRCGSQS